MIQLLGGLELGVRLLDIDIVLGLLLADDLQGIRLPPEVLSLIRRIVLPAPSPSSLTTRYFIPESSERFETFAIRTLIPSDSGQAFARKNTSSGCAHVLSPRGPAFRGRTRTSPRNTVKEAQLRIFTSSTSKIRLDLGGILSFSMSP